MDGAEVTEVNIPETITKINEYTFRGCYGITSLTIPVTLKSIDNNAFADCSLTTIRTKAVVPPAIYAGSFSDKTYKECQVWVPVASVTEYMKDWSKFANIYTEEATENVITVSSPGDLINKISPSQAESIVNLKLVGQINGTDILTVNKLVNLVKLDLSEAIIVSGGMPYYEKDNERFGTEDNTLGQNWAYNLEFLSEIKLPSTLEKIENRAFAGMNRLRVMSIPTTVNDVAENAFSNCTLLSELTFEDCEATLKIGSGTFDNCTLEKVYLGRDLLCGSNYRPFRNKTSLSEITLGNTVSKIDDCAFDGCSGLASITIPSSVTSIGNYAFDGCVGLKNLTIEDSESTLTLGYGYYSTSRKQGLFNDCALEKLYLGRDLSYDSSCQPFRNITALKEVTIGNTVTGIGGYAFSGCSGLTSIAIPNSVTSIGQSAFSGCEGLTEISLPTSLTKIESSTFNGCTSLEAIAIPDPVTTIGYRAFYDCSALKSVTFPGSLREIGESAFSGCSGLENIYAINPIPAVIESSTFSSEMNQSVALHVPENSSSIYWIHPYWGKFKNLTTWNSGSEESFVVDEVTYHVTSEADATVEITAANISRVSRSGENKLEIPATVEFRGSTYRVTGVANNGFEGSDLTALDLPATISYVGLEAFKGCNSLKEIICRAVLPPSANNNSFDQTTYSTARLNVPEEAITAYKDHAVWSLFEIGEAPDKSDIEEVIIADEEQQDADARFDIYNLRGMLIKRDATDDDLKELRPDVYILRQGAKARKVMVK